MGSFFQATKYLYRALLRRTIVRQNVIFLDPDNEIDYHVKEKQTDNDNIDSQRVHAFLLAKLIYEVLISFDLFYDDLFQISKHLLHFFCEQEFGAVHCFR